jgi:hypothetical protein
MTDDDFFKQIGLVEDELVDQYLDDQLPPPDRRRFEETFLRAPDRQQKLRFARALRTYANRAAGHPEAGHARERKAPWQPILAFLNPLRPVPAYSLAAALLAVVTGGTWQFVRIARLESHVVQLQAEQRRAHDEQQLRSSQLVALTEKADQLATQLREERERRPEPKAPLLALATPLPFTLSPGILRGTESSRRLEIPAGTALVELRLDMAQNTHQTYRAVLLSENREILSRSGLKASETARQILLSLDVPVSALPSGDYKIDLYGSGEREALDTYVFRVTRRP